MLCSGCPEPMPVVSERVAEGIAQRLAGEHRTNVLIHCFGWLATKHEGLTLYLGVNGRPYAPQEQASIARETGVVFDLPCPLRESRGCLLGVVGVDRIVTLDVPGEVFGWLPTLLAKRLDRNALASLVRDRTVADAKIAQLSRKTDFPGSKRSQIRVLA